MPVDLANIFVEIVAMVGTLVLHVAPKVICQTCALPKTTLKFLTEAEVVS